MSNVPGIILAGGLARRMGGGDKSLLDLGGRPILDHVIERLKPQVSEIALNANGDPSRFAEYDLPVIADSEPDFPGPLAGVLAGMDWAASRGAQSILTVAADTPFFPSDLAARLKTARQSENAGIALAGTMDATRGMLRQPVFGLWNIELRDDLRSSLRAGLRKIVLWTERHDAVTVAFSTAQGDPFFNLNRPEDIVQAEATMKALM